MTWEREGTVIQVKTTFGNYLKSGIWNYSKANVDLDLQPKGAFNLIQHLKYRSLKVVHQKANVDISLQPNERITLELMAKKTVYCERNTVIVTHCY